MLRSRGHGGGAYNGGRFAASGSVFRVPLAVGGAISEHFLCHHLLRGITLSRQAVTAEDVEVRSCVVVLHCGSGLYPPSAGQRWQFLPNLPAGPRHAPCTVRGLAVRGASGNIDVSSRRVVSGGKVFEWYGEGHCLADSYPFFFSGHKHQHLVKGRRSVVATDAQHRFSDGEGRTVSYR